MKLRYKLASILLMVATIVIAGLTVSHPTAAELERQRCEKFARVLIAQSDSADMSYQQIMHCHEVLGQ